MLNSVNVNYIVVMLVTGALLLASIYHTILCLHRRTPLLSTYSTYLWATFIYCLFRCIYIKPSYPFYNYFNPDEILQMLAFGLYIRFASVALNLDKQRDRLAYRFVRIAPYAIIGSLLVNTWSINYSGDGIPLDAYARLAIRTYLLIFGLLILVLVLRKRQTVFYRYLAAGEGCMIFFGIVSSVMTIAGHRDSFILSPLSMIMFGFFLDVIFFSSAIGYQLRQENIEREKSLQGLLDKEVQLQQKEMEKLKAIFITREEERLRISRDLHDDMGSTLSSINIYAKVVGDYIESDKEKATTYLDKIQGTAKELMEHTNDLIWSLQTNYGERQSIYQHIQTTAVDMLSSANITPFTYIDPSNLPRLTIQAQKAIWLLFKEAINNACKYSQAKSCVITIAQIDNLLSISITDDGKGFSVASWGNGLRNMTARATEFEGTCTVKSSPEKGTSVNAVFPIAKIIAPDAVV